jgi:hypothetical protein
MKMKHRASLKLGDDGELLQDRADTITLPVTRRDVPQAMVTGLSIPPAEQPIVTDKVDQLTTPVTCKYCGTENLAGGPLQCIKCGGWLVELSHFSTSVQRLSYKRANQYRWLTDLITTRQDIAVLIGIPMVLAIELLVINRIAERYSHFIPGLTVLFFYWAGALWIIRSSSDKLP